MIVAFVSNIVQNAPFDVESAVGDIVQQGATFLRNSLLALLGNASSAIITVIIMYVANLLSQHRP